MNKLLIVLIVVMILAIIGFVLSGVVNATVQESIGQNNSTSRNEQKIIVTWLETNDTKTSSDTPVISINSEDFWKIFEPLVKQFKNGSS
jgi:Na+-translocating ferredoxin:NAD+ oxidoreductase RnfG subunit